MAADNRPGVGGLWGDVKRLKYLIIAALLLVACSDNADPPEAVTQVLVDEFGATVYVVEGDGVRCVIADVDDGVGVDCDWEDR